ncbi:concanavalin A-like lectin/glucanase domain-containing protein [Dissophora ornata]|nr:concanavalin A-like lectin/glucanase domain-containing protein [Dissophora ornata]
MNAFSCNIAHFFQIVDGTCHKTSLEACSIALGCEPGFSHALSTKKKTFGSEEDEGEDPAGCFPLPVCRSFRETFKHNNEDKKGHHKALIPKLDFIGDSDLAHWTSDFDHIAPYATVDPKQKRLVLKAKRDLVKTQSGGGFGATVSSTRWNRYGTFSAKFKSGATGPGIVAAMMLTNPMHGEEITIEVTGRDPKIVITDFYRHSARSDSQHDSWLPSLKSVVPSMDGIRTRTRKLKDIVMPGKKDKDDTITSDNNSSEKENNSENDKNNDDASLERSHALKRPATENELVYTIEWTPDKIQWSVDGVVLRTITSKDLLKENGYGLPSHPMLFQFTIWDAGYNKETEIWAGGRTDYGVKDDREYSTLIEWIDIACHDRKEARRNPWPGTDALKRLAAVEKEEKEERKAQEKEAQKKEKEAMKNKKKAINAADESAKFQYEGKTDGWLFGRGEGSQKDEDRLKKSQRKNYQTSKVDQFIDAVVHTLLKWATILVIAVGSASYLTQPRSVSAQRT